MRAVCPEAPFSTGILQSHGNDTANELLARADTVLYRAKETRVARGRRLPANGGIRDSVLVAARAPTPTRVRPTATGGHPSCGGRNDRSRNSSRRSLDPRTQHARTRPDGRLHPRARSGRGPRCRAAGSPLSMAIEFSPNGGHEFPRWWPSFLPAAALLERRDDDRPRPQGTAAHADHRDHDHRHRGTAACRDRDPLGRRRTHRAGGQALAPWSETADTGGHGRADPRLAEHHPDDQIASILNKQDRRTGTGLLFSAPRVKHVRQQNNIPVAPPPDPDSGIFTIKQAADELGVTETTIYRWLREGLLPGEQTTPHPPWRIRLTPEVRRGSCPTSPRTTCRWIRPRSGSGVRVKRFCIRSNAVNCTPSRSSRDGEKAYEFRCCSPQLDCLTNDDGEEGSVTMGRTARRSRGPRAGRSIPACGAPAGSGRDHGPLGFPRVKCLAGRQPGRASACPDRRPVAARGLLGEQDPAGLGVFPALRGRGGDHVRRRAAAYGSLRRCDSTRARPDAAAQIGVLSVIAVPRPLCRSGQLKQLRWENPGLARVKQLGGRSHRRPVEGVVVELLSGCATPPSDGGVYHLRVEIHRGCPVGGESRHARPSQLRVERCGECSSEAGGGTGSTPRATAADAPVPTRGHRHRTGRPARMRVRACVDLGGAVQLGEVDRSAILRRTGCAPAAAAVISHRSAP